MRLCSTALAVTLAALAGLGLSGATASAVTLGQAGGLKYVRTGTSVSLGGFEDRNARCGGAWHVFGGGVSISGPTISGQLESTAPFDGDDANGHPDDGWLGEVSNLGSVPLTLKTYAVCSHASPDYGQATSQTFAVGSISSASTSCGAPQRAVGGGIRSLTVPGNTHLVHTLPSADLAEWEGGVYADAGPPDAAFRTYEICAGGVDASFESQDEEIESAPASAAVSADCPGGTHVTGGGASIEATIANSRNSWINTSRPFDGNDPGHVPDDGWTARVQLGAGADGVSAYAVCAN
jgi:hypothetical protein